MNERRKVLVGAGAALLGGSAAAVDRGASHWVYAHGLVWNPELPDPWNQLRLDAYLAVGPEGRGTGRISDPLNAWANAHLRVYETLRQGNRHEFSGEITAAATAAFVGLAVVVVAAAQGEATVLKLTFADQSFSGLGRITNIRAAATLGPVSIPLPFLP